MDLERYTHKNVAAQIEQYRQIYAENLKSDFKNFDNYHLNGLFQVLISGFSLSRDYILENIKDDQRRSSLLENIQKIYDLAKEYEEDQKLTRDNFLDLNLWLAFVVSMSKEEHISLNTYDIDLAKEVIKNLNKNNL